MNQQSIRRDAKVRNREGVLLGTVVVSGERTFIVAFEGKEFSARYADVERMDGDEVVLRAELAELKRRDEAEGGDPEGGGYRRRPASE